MAAKSKISTIDEYITPFPADVQAILQRMRQTIHDAAPTVEEAISYGIPTFKLNGNLVHFAAYKKHVGFYPAPSGIEAFREELSPFEVSTGTIKFPLDQPIPYDLVRRITAYRAAEQQNK